MAYRDRDPLEVQETALATELATLERRAREVQQALDDARAKKRTARSLPLLSNTTVASPCSARWEDMVGDEQSRFCGSCGKNVYDLSSMTAAAAEELIAAKDGSLCVRFYRRKDGTVLTQDCPVGRRRKRVTRAAAVGAGAAFLGLGAMGTMAGAMTMGARMPSETAVAKVPADLVQGYYSSKTDTTNNAPREAREPSELGERSTVEQMPASPAVTVDRLAPEGPQSTRQR